MDNDAIEASSPSDYKDYFLNPSENKNPYSNSGYFEYIDSKEGNITLLFIEYNNTFSLRYDYNIPKAQAGNEYYSIGDPETMSIIVDAGDEEYIPLGSCISPELSWRIINDFFNNPKIISTNVSWLNSEEIDWNEIF